MIKRNNSLIPLMFFCETLSVQLTRHIDSFGLKIIKNYDQTSFLKGLHFILCRDLPKTI